MIAPEVPAAPVIALPVEPVPPPAALEPAVPTPIAEPPRSIFGVTIWLLLGLLAAAAAAAAIMHWQRNRRIELTRAALALKPRIDLTAGRSSTPGLSLASPPLSIRVRLAVDG